MTFGGIPLRACEFYAGLEADNSRAYWNAHKATYERDVKAPLQALAELVEAEFGEPKLFRPHRDVRFSADKSPYKDHQGLVIGQPPALGYYVQISADGLALGGGFHAGSPAQTAAWRAAVDAPASGAALAKAVDAAVAEGAEIRALVPVNLREAGDAGSLGNHFGLVALELPVGIENPLARLYATRSRMEALKGSYQAPVTYSILGLVGMVPRFVQQQILDLLASKATAVMTNVPGPQAARYLAGSKLEQQMFWVPQSGSIGIGVSVLSYDGRVQFGLITDKGLVDNPEDIVARFSAEFEKLLWLVLIEPWSRLADPDSVEKGLLE